MTSRLGSFSKRSRSHDKLAARWFLLGRKHAKSVACLDDAHHTIDAQREMRSCARNVDLHFAGARFADADTARFRPKHRRRGEPNAAYVQLGGFDYSHSDLQAVACAVDRDQQLVRYWNRDPGNTRR